MNKFQRAKSKRIKKLQREMPGISYKKAKRLDRTIMRNAKRLAAQVARISSGLLTFGHEISAVTESLTSLRKALTEQKLSEDKPKCTGLGTSLRLWRQLPRCGLRRIRIFRRRSLMTEIANVALYLAEKYGLISKKRS